MDEIGAFALLVAVGYLSVHGVIYIVAEPRPFSAIAKECAERGYIQNNKTRIFCSVEDKGK